MSNHAQGSVEASMGDESSPKIMNGLRPTVEKGGRQALSAISSAGSHRRSGHDHHDHTTDSSSAGRRKDSPAPEHAEVSSDVARRKKGGTKAGNEKVQ
tara:strand:- start:412 stop:705 length:294 start_codon:yes stop_codon:yes gene_type:complete